MNAEATKPCSACKETLPASAFSSDRRNTSGLQSRCKECNNRASRERLAELRKTEPARRWPGRPRADTCAIDGCIKAPGKRRGWCKMHYDRWQRTRDTGPVTPILGTGDAVTYRTAHTRLTRTRGPASGYACVDCGGPALHWSYDGGSYKEQISPQGAPYTTDLSCYSSRCNGCHKRLDAPPPPTCPQGHEMTEANTYRYRSGRVCRACKIAKQAERHRRQRSTPEGLEQQRAYFREAGRRRRARAKG